MLCYAMSCYVMLCNVMVCYVTLYHAMLYSAMLCITTPCFTTAPIMLHNVMSCYAMPCRVTKCYAMLCCVMCCCVMLCYTPTDQQTSRPPDHRTSASLCNSLGRTTRPQTTSWRMVELVRWVDLVRTLIQVLDSGPIFGEERNKNTFHRWWSWMSW